MSEDGKQHEQNEQQENQQNDDEQKYETITPTTLAGAEVKDIKKVIEASQSSVNAPQWSSNQFYNRGQIAQYNRVKYQCISSHTSKPFMNPQYSTTFWKPVI